MSDIQQKKPVNQSSSKKSRAKLRVTSKSLASGKKSSPDNLWTKISLFFFKRWLSVLLIWLIGVCGSIYVYSNVIAKDGLPSIAPPFVTISSHYFVNDSRLVDAEITQPLHGLLDSFEEVEYVSSYSYDNGSFTNVGLKLDAEEGLVAEKLRQRLESQDRLMPGNARINVEVPQITRFLGKYDVLISLYDPVQTSDWRQLGVVAQIVVEELQGEDYLQAVEIIELSTLDQQTGQSRPISFNRLGLAQLDHAGENEIVFYKAIHIGLARDAEKTDYLGLAQSLDAKLADINKSGAIFNLEVKTVADFATSIERNLDSLESNLLTGLIIISILSFLLISWRASIVIVLSMVTVLATTILMLYLIGYTLNVVTLFALILALGLLVDDAVIMTEALDLYKQKNLSDREVIKRALKRILLASLAGTLTTSLVFVPLIFVSGILGEFIRYIPLTLVVILLTSFIFSVTLIPVWSKLTILREKRGDWFKRINPFLIIEKKLAKFFAAIPLLLKTNPRAGKSLRAVLLIFAGGAVALSFAAISRVGLDIFSSPKDTPFMYYTVTFPSGYSLREAEQAAILIDQVVARELKDDLLVVNYINDRLPDERSMNVALRLRPLSEREEYSSVLSDKLQEVLNAQIDPSIEITVGDGNAGPENPEYPFVLNLKANDTQKAGALVQEIAGYLQSDELGSIQSFDGQSHKIERVRVSDGTQVIQRLNGDTIFTVTARYDSGSINNELLKQTKELVMEKFNAAYLAAGGYDSDIFDVPETSVSFEDSFNSLGYIFPAALLLIYLLLSYQFRSWLQPLVLFTALPFALVGVSSWLFITETPMSFLVGIGFITLLGVVVNNTILLTTYANVARQRVGNVEAISLAVSERFRPLLITTATTVLALLPLAINDFFWQNLALTIIWGLVSNTVLVLLVFPYFYLMFAKFIKVKKEAS